MFRHLLLKLFARHTWAYSETGERRTCTVCGRADEYHGGGGVDGAVWIQLIPGTITAHTRRAAPAGEAVVDAASSTDHRSAA